MASEGEDDDELPDVEEVRGIDPSRCGERIVDAGDELRRHAEEVREAAGLTATPAPEVPHRDDDGGDGEKGVRHLTERRRFRGPVRDPEPVHLAAEDSVRTTEPGHEPRDGARERCNGDRALPWPEVTAVPVSSRGVQVPASDEHARGGDAD